MGWRENPWIFDNEVVLVGDPSKDLPSAEDIENALSKEPPEREWAWKSIVKHALIRRGHYILGDSDHPDYLVTVEPDPTEQRTGGATRWIVGCSIQAPTVSADQLLTIIDEAKASGYIGFHREKDCGNFVVEVLEKLPQRVRWELPGPWELNDRTALPTSITKVLNRHFSDPLFNRVAALRNPYSWVTAIGLVVLMAFAKEKGFQSATLSYFEFVATGILLWYPYIYGFSRWGVVAGIALATMWGVTLYQLWMGLHWAVAAPICFLLSVFFTKREARPWLIGFSLGVIPLYAFAGSYNFGRDLLISLLVLAGVLFAVSRYKTRLDFGLVMIVNAFGGNREHWRAGFATLAWLVSTWLAMSACDYAFGPHWIRPLSPLDLPGHNVAVNATERIGLTLSGGGYRAALVHSGVLYALAERKVAPSSITSVSGGSIIGGYYALGGTPETFRDAVIEGQFNLKRELVDAQNAVRLACPARVPGISVRLLWFCPSYSRSDVQASLLDRRLFQGRNVVEKPLIPWMIATTELATGNAVGFAAGGGVVRLSIPTHDSVRNSGRMSKRSAAPDFFQLPSVKLSSLAAASGAFPGALTAVRVSDNNEHELVLADGGLLDNLGVALALAARKLAPTHPELRSWHTDRVLVSDASVRFESDIVVSPLAELARGLDTVYAASGLEFDADPVDPVQILLLSPYLPFVTSELSDVPTPLRKTRGVSTIKELTADIDKTIATFRRSSTLRDQYSKEDADDLFALGQYMVYLQAFPHDERNSKHDQMSK